MPLQPATSTAVPFQFNFPFSNHSSLQQHQHLQRRCFSHKKKKHAAEDDSDQSGGDEWDIELTAYIPFERLLGASGRKFAFIVGDGLLGKTREQLRLEYGVDYIEVDELSAREQHKMAGLNPTIGTTRGHSYLHLPPTEWTELETRVRLHFGDDQQVAGYSLSLIYQPHPAARGAILEFFERNLGHAQESTDLLGDHVWRFPGEPAVQLKDDDITGAWDVHVSH